MTPSAFTLLGLTALVAALVALVVFALLRFVSAARDARVRVRTSGGEAAFVTGVLEEAVARLRAQERALAERAEASERLSGEIVTSLSAGLLLVDGDGHVRILNPAGRRMLGLAADASPGSYRQVLKGAAPLADAVEECLSTPNPIVRRALKLPGEAPVVSHLGVTVSPLVEPSGRPHGVICLFTDLSAVIEMEEQLRLKDSLARVGELTAGIAHEFRNGLATIHGYALLMDLDQLPPTYRTYVEGIREETTALGQIVTNFLNFARPTYVTLAPIDLQTIAERAADEVRGEAQMRGGTIVVRGSFPTIQGDEVLLRQAFVNLARNALEACIASGTPPAIVVDGAIDRDQAVARVSVNDNGPGIPEEARERVFRPFFTTRKQGTGLGLPLVQKIVVTHNGRISIGTSPAGGASMQISLPLTIP